MNKINNLNEIIKSMIINYQEENFDKAELCANKIIERSDKHILSWKILSAIYEKKGNLDEAKKACGTALQLAPDDPEVHYSYGIILFRLNYFADAKDSFGRAIELNKNFDKAYNNLGITYHKLNMYEKAKSCYEKAIEINKNYTTAYYNLALTFEKLSKYDEAEINYTNTLNLKPNHEEALLGRGEILIKKGKLDKALKDFDKCNSKDSRSRALVLLYELKRYDEIFKRIKKNIELDDENLKVASFSSFISNKLKRDTGHKFCKNPLEFIYNSNLSIHLNDKKKFIDKLIYELKEIQSTWEPLNKSTIKGFQSDKNIFKNPKNNISELKSILLTEIKMYYEKFKDKKCSFISKWPQKKNLFGWHVELKSQGYQTAHIHPSGWLSGVIYLKVVPSKNINEGAIEFSLNGRHYSDINSPKEIYNPKIGDIVFFPSSLHHRTIPFTSDTNRIIISFDLIPDISIFKELNFD